MSFWFSKRQRCSSSNAMVKVWAKRANCSVFGCTDEHRTLFRVPASEETREQVVDCGLWNVGPLLFNGCAKLLDIGRNWNTLSYTPIQSIPNNAHWVTCPVSMLAMQELGCFQLPGIVYRSLQHGAVHYHAATWADGRGWMAQQWASGSRHGISVFKMHLCSLSIIYACPYHNRTAIMGHSIHNVDISKPLTQTMPYTLSAICPVQWKPGFIRKENTSPKCQMPSNVSMFPLKSVTMTDCSQVEIPIRTTSMQMSFLETFLTVCAEIIWLCKPIVAVAVRMAGLRRSWRWRCWMWRSWAGVETLLEMAYGREMNIQLMGNSSGGHSCSQHANCTLPQNLWNLWHCAVW